MRKGIRLMLIAFVVGMLLCFSCFALAQPREETLIHDTVTGVIGTPDDFNTWAGWRWPDRGLHQYCLEPLWIAEPATGEILPLLAKAWPPEYNEDFTKMTIRLREGIYWNDGVPFTADDVVFTIELHKRTPQLLMHGPMAEYVKEVRKIDDYTVEVELTKPNSRFHSYFLDRWGALRPMPKHIFEKVEDPVTFKFNPPVGTGPYVLESYDPAGYWTTWKRREDWDRSATGQIYGEPKPKYITTRVFATEEAKILALLNGELDLAYLSVEGMRAAMRAPHVRTWRKEWPWACNIDPFVPGLVFNHMKEPYNLRDVRWALTLAINIEEFMTIAADLMAPVSPIHIPPVPAYKKAYFEPMYEWLVNFELDLGNGEKFKPFDPEVPFKLAALAKKKGYPVPEDPEAIKDIFGIGWWKYAPDVAEKLLTKHGFFKDEFGRWHLPDGSLWRIQLSGHPEPTTFHHRTMLAAADQWRKFGIGVETWTPVAFTTLNLLGEFEVNTTWAALEPWGAGVDLYRTLWPFHSSQVRPIGEYVAFDPGGSARWSDPRMDEIIAKLEKVDIADEKATIELGLEALKLLVEEMPTTPVYGGIAFLGWSEMYWTNYPGAENLYPHPWHWWPNFKLTLPFLKPAKE